ncbi:threonine aldolase family protein [Roseateles chitinivorans]|uniref:threonine aldolase family protein n=1 Tax=Roseateles chitinivorans TaxID=2917965 RepID=UPI003D671D81
MTPSETQALKQRCTRWVSGFATRSFAEELETVAAWARANEVSADIYGEGGAVELLEQRVAGLLGKPAAVFMPSGVMAQLIALRLHADEKRLPRFGMHATCHLATEEEQAFSQLMNLHATVLGQPHRTLTRGDLAQPAEALAAVVLELPARVIGGQSPPWDELAAIKEWAATSGTRLHLDGARLWEAAAWYGKRYDEIVAGVDTVYVSTYKGLGGFSGALLAGEARVMAEARVWRRRMGGTIYQLAPLAASAACRLDERLALMPRLFERTVQVVEALSQVAGLRINPAAPHANMFHVHMDGDVQRLVAARNEIADTDGLWLFNAARETGSPGRAVSEIYVGDNLLALSDEVVVDAFQRLIARSNRV